MYYISILKNRNGQLKIEYTEIHPEILKEDLEAVYYEAYKNEKEAHCRFNSLKLYGNAWAQLKRRIEKSLR